MDLLNQLTQNTICITPNRRLSANLLKRYQDQQLQQNKLTWHTPDILPLSSWIQRIWLAYCAKHIASHPMMLTPTQQQLVWESIIKQSPINDVLLQLSATADMAKSAWMTLQQWRVTSHPLLGMTEDSQAFQRWAEIYKDICTKKNWMDESVLIECIAEKIQQRLIELPKKMIVIGFTELTPQQRFLLQCIEESGTAVTLNPEEKKSACLLKRISLLNEETEILTMARFAKYQYDQANTTKIACIIPHLETMRDQVIDIFSAVFSEKNTFTLDYTSLPFNISAGKSLNTYPVIHIALLMLGLHSNTITLATITSILRSPFIMNAECEYIQRAHCIQDLQESRVTTFTLESIISRLKPFSLTLEKCFSELSHLFKSLPKQGKLSDWMQFFMKILHCLGWPGERSVNSHEYQVIQCWLETINQLEAYDTLSDSCQYFDALHYLMTLTTNTIFQPQSPEAPIQILGLLEAIDIPFDYVWIMGCDDTRWPAPAKPNPFIPYRLQTLLQMPHATAERELHYCVRLMEQITAQTPFCIVSHAMQSADGELRASQLIQAIPEITLDELPLAHFQPLAPLIYQNRQIEYIIDVKARAIQPNELIRGGVSILKLQAACPFKAFAEIRLQAKSFDDAGIGLRSTDRGNIVHHALELFWQDIHDSKQLSELSDHDLKNIIQRVAQCAIESFTEQSIQTKRYYELECKRLTHLLYDWLQIEKMRPPFRVIAQEKEHSITLGQGHIPITMRVDRIDELMDGTYLIIDYKTGKDNEINAWFSDRPDDPQLPFYCIFSPDLISGIAYGQINRTKLMFKGLASHDLGIPSIRPIHTLSSADHRPWSEQLAEWKVILEKLGDQFNQGHAEINPKDPLSTCQYCKLQGLCRKHDHDTIEEDYE